MSFAYGVESIIKSCNTYFNLVKKAANSDTYNQVEEIIRQPYYFADRFIEQVAPFANYLIGAENPTPSKPESSTSKKTEKKQHSVRVYGFLSTQDVKSMNPVFVSKEYEDGARSFKQQPFTFLWAFPKVHPVTKKPSGSPEDYFYLVVFDEGISYPIVYINKLNYAKNFKVSINEAPESMVLEDVYYDRSGIYDEIMGKASPQQEKMQKLAQIIVREMKESIKGIIGASNESIYEEEENEETMPSIGKGMKLTDTAKSQKTVGYVVFSNLANIRKMFPKADKLYLEKTLTENDKKSGKKAVAPFGLNSSFDLRRFFDDEAMEFVIDAFNSNPEKSNDSQAAMADAIYSLIEKYIADGKAYVSDGNNEAFNENQKKLFKAHEALFSVKEQTSMFWMERIQNYVRVAEEIKSLHQKLGILVTRNPARASLSGGKVIISEAVKPKMEDIILRVRDEVYLSQTSDSDSIPEDVVDDAKKVGSALGVGPEIKTEFGIGEALPSYTKKLDATRKYDGTIEVSKDVAQSINGLLAYYDEDSVFTMDAILNNDDDAFWKTYEDYINKYKFFHRALKEDGFEFNISQRDPIAESLEEGKDWTQERIKFLERKYVPETFFPSEEEAFPKINVPLKDVETGEQLLSYVQDPVTGQPQPKPINKQVDFYDSEILKAIMRASEDDAAVLEEAVKAYSKINVFSPTETEEKSSTVQLFHGLAQDVAKEVSDYLTTDDKERAIGVIRAINLAQETGVPVNDMLDIRNNIFASIDDIGSKAEKLLYDATMMALRQDASLASVVEAFHPNILEEYVLGQINRFVVEVVALETKKPFDAGKPQTRKDKTNPATSVFYDIENKFVKARGRNVSFDFDGFFEKIRSSVVQGTTTQSDTFSFSGFAIKYVQFLKNLKKDLLNKSATMAEAEETGNDINFGADPAGASYFKGIASSRQEAIKNRLTAIYGREPSEAEMMHYVHSKAVLSNRFKTIVSDIMNELPNKISRAMTLRLFRLIPRIEELLAGQSEAKQFVSGVVKSFVTKYVSDNREKVMNEVSYNIESNKYDSDASFNIEDIWREFTYRYPNIDKFADEMRKLSEGKTADKIRRDLTYVVNYLFSYYEPDTENGEEYFATLPDDYMSNIVNNAANELKQLDIIFIKALSAAKEEIGYDDKFAAMQGEIGVLYSAIETATDGLSKQTAQNSLKDKRKEIEKLMASVSSEAANIFFTAIENKDPEYWDDFEALKIIGHQYSRTEETFGADTEEFAPVKGFTGLQAFSAYCIDRFYDLLQPEMDPNEIITPEDYVIDQVYSMIHPAVSRVKGVTKETVEYSIRDTLRYRRISRVAPKEFVDVVDFAVKAFSKLDASLSESMMEVMQGEDMPFSAKGAGFIFSDEEGEVNYEKARNNVIAHTISKVKTDGTLEDSKLPELVFVQKQAEKFNIDKYMVERCAEIYADYVSAKRPRFDSTDIVLNGVVGVLPVKDLIYLMVQNQAEEMNGITFSESDVANFAKQRILQTGAGAKLAPMYQTRIQKTYEINHKRMDELKRIFTPAEARDLAMIIGNFYSIDIALFKKLYTRYTKALKTFVPERQVKLFTVEEKEFENIIKTTILASEGGKSLMDRGVSESLLRAYAYNRTNELTENGFRSIFKFDSVEMRNAVTHLIKNIYKQEIANRGLTDGDIDQLVQSGINNFRLRNLVSPDIMAVKMLANKDAAEAKKTGDFHIKFTDKDVITKTKDSRQEGLYISIDKMSLNTTVEEVQQAKAERERKPKNLRWMDYLILIATDKITSKADLLEIESETEPMDMTSEEVAEQMSMGGADVIKQKIKEQKDRNSIRQDLYNKFTTDGFNKLITLASMLPPSGDTSQEKFYYCRIRIITPGVAYFQQQSAFRMQGETIEEAAKRLQDKTKVEYIKSDNMGMDDLNIEMNPGVLKALRAEIYVKSPKAAEEGTEEGIEEATTEKTEGFGAFTETIKAFTRNGIVFCDAILTEETIEKVKDEFSSYYDSLQFYIDRHADWIKEYSNKLKRVPVKDVSVELPEELKEQEEAQIKAQQAKETGELPVVMDETIDPELTESAPQEGKDTVEEDIMQQITGVPVSMETSTEEGEEAASEEDETEEKVGVPAPPETSEEDKAKEKADAREERLRMLKDIHQRSEEVKKEIPLSKKSK